MNELRRLYARARPYRSRLLAGVACALLAALFAPAMAELSEQLVSLLERAKGLHARGVLFERVVFFALLIPALALAKGLVSFGSDFLLAHVAQSVLRDLRVDLYRTLVERPISYLFRTPTGELISRVTNDVQRIEVGLSLRLKDLVENIPIAVFTTAYLWYQNWKLALIGTVVVPLAGVLVRRWSRKIKAAGRRAQELNASLSSVLGETLSGARVVKAYGAEQHEISRFDRVNDDLRRVSLRASKTMALTSPVLEALGGLLLAGLVGVAAYEIAAGHLEPKHVVAFVTAVTAGLYRSVKKVGSSWNELQNTIAASRRCFEILDDEGAIEPTGSVTLDGLEHGIELRDVTFAYGETPVIQDFSLDVRKGEIVALVGESGAGKSTMLDLLCRFRDPTGGAILWDGVNLRDVEPKSLRRQVALVTQDAVVFDETVTRNIAYGDAHPDPARVEAAARAAHAHDFIGALEQGYETRLGERGNRLSGGQRQRITIARALYRDAPVWILDEATSALDSQSERILQEALDELIVGRTVFIVAHRLATVRRAHRIVVMADGRIVQEGTHEELLEQDGTYRQLHHLQSGIT